MASVKTKEHCRGPLIMDFIAQMAAHFYVKMLVLLVGIGMHKTGAQAVKQLFPWKILLVG